MYVIWKSEWTHKNHSCSRRIWMHIYLSHKWNESIYLDVQYTKTTFEQKQKKNERLDLFFSISSFFLSNILLRVQIYLFSKTSNHKNYIFFFFLLANIQSKKKVSKHRDMLINIWMHLEQKHKNTTPNWRTSCFCFVFVSINWYFINFFLFVCVCTVLRLTWTVTDWRSNKKKT